MGCALADTVRARPIEGDCAPTSRPVMLGRYLLKTVIERHVHDLYNFVVGAAAIGIVTAVTRSAYDFVWTLSLQLERFPESVRSVLDRGPRSGGQGALSSDVPSGSNGGLMMCPQVGRALYALVTVGVVLPFLTGYLVELIFIAPLSVDAEEMTVWFPLQVREMAAWPPPGTLELIVHRNGPPPGARASPLATDISGGPDHRTDCIPVAPAWATVAHPRHGSHGS